MHPSTPSTARPRWFLSRAIVVIPALDEAECIAATVRRWRECGAAVVRVVDNGSADNTADIAAAAGAVVMSEPQRGYGAAAWRGTGELPAGVDWIVFSSADGSDQLDDESAARFQVAIDGGAELVLGERVSLPESRVHLGPVQARGNAFTCALIRVGWGHRFRDMASLRAIRVDALARLNLADRGFGWNVEMQVRALEHRLEIAEVPVRYFPRAAGRPKISGSPTGVLKAGWGILSMIARLRFAPARMRSADLSPTQPATTRL